jgi:hypothetical protein
MNTIKHPIFITLLAAVMLFSQSPLLQASNNTGISGEIGSVQVIVQDDQGQVVPHAPIYIYDDGLAKVLESGPTGMVTVDLKRGKYSISSARSNHAGDWVDRFASPTAVVQVTAQDLTSIVLTLYPVQDPISELSLSTLQKLGVADQVAQYTN